MTAVNSSNRGRPVRALTRMAAFAALLALAACSASVGGATTSAHQSGAGQMQAAAANPDLDPGTSQGGRAAPDFQLVNQFGQQMSLSQFRGKVVVLAFTDSECTTVCPLTTVSMVEAKDLLGAAGDEVQLLGIDANPAATKVSDVMAYSRAHAMVNQWDFLTGSPAQLRAVWKAYYIYVAIAKGQVDHTPALYVIDQRGREEKVYLTTMAYASVGQEAQVLAQEVASLLPGHPRLASQGSLAHITGLGPTARVTLAAAPSGTITIAPGHAHLLVFFASWLSETSDLKSELTALSGYARKEGPGKLPQLVGVDEAVTEPSPDSARSFLAQLGHPLGYPVALDTTGRVADGYGVQDQPWYVLTSATGKILWQHDGWLPVSAVMAAARKA
jgi:cytochrome oxidase Cu insertion factor (SCO1/SenC/PrrC family)